MDRKPMYSKNFRSLAATRRQVFRLFIFNLVIAPNVLIYIEPTHLRADPIRPIR